MGFRDSKPKMQHSGTLLQEGVKRTQIVVSGKILYQEMLKITIIFVWAWLTLFKLDHCFLDYIFDVSLFFSCCSQKILSEPQGQDLNKFDVV